MQGREAVGTLAAQWLRLAGGTDVQRAAQHLQLAPLGLAGSGAAAALNATLAAAQQPQYDQIHQALASQLLQAGTDRPAAPATAAAGTYANAQLPQLLHDRASEATAINDVVSL